MILLCLPVDQKNVSVGLFNAALQLVRAVSRHAGNDVLRARKHFLELKLLICFNIECGNFQYHVSNPTFPGQNRDAHFSSAAMATSFLLILANASAVFPSTSCVVMSAP